MTDNFTLYSTNGVTSYLEDIYCFNDERRKKHQQRIVTTSLIFQMKKRSQSKHIETENYSNGNNFIHQIQQSKPKARPATSPKKKIVGYQDLKKSKADYYISSQKN